MSAVRCPLSARVTFSPRANWRSSPSASRSHYAPREAGGRKGLEQFQPAPARRARRCYGVGVAADMPSGGLTKKTMASARSGPSLRTSPLTPPGM
jgi:hypothetical protein